MFSLAVDGSGAVTLTQFAQIDHAAEVPSGAPFDDQLAVLATNLVSLTASATITDFDGDTATSSQTVDLGGNIQFADDGPSLTVAAASDTGVLLTTQDADTVGAASDTAVSTANFNGVFTIASQSFGADGAGTAPSLSYVLAITATPVGGVVDSGLDSHGAQINLFAVGGRSTGRRPALRRMRLPTRCSRLRWTAPGR